ncbi:MAG: family 10 glycosylhydrolase [bacterium]|nr:family 10 glycosylhydrolase [bacterium]
MGLSGLTKKPKNRRPKRHQPVQIHVGFLSIIFTLVLLFTVNSCITVFSKNKGTQYTQPKLIEHRGVWIRPPKDINEIPKILDDLTTARFTMAFVETFYHGFTIYPSRVFPQRPEYIGKNVLQTFINEAKKRDLEIHCWLEIFYWRPSPETDNPQTPLLDEHPDWLDLDINGITTEKFESNHYFVNPSVPAVQQKLKELVAELCSTYAIAGINLDYIRYAAGTSQFGYNAYALDKFKRLYAYDPRTIDRTKDTVKWLEWSRFREQQVTDVVAMINQEIKQKNKSVKLSAAVFPDYYKNRFHDSRLQDWATWCQEGYLDFLTPMCYRYSLDGIQEEIKISQSNSGVVPVYPGLAVRAGTKHPELTQQIQLARDMGCNGVVVFCYSWMTTFPNIFIDLGNMK